MLSFSKALRKLKRRSGYFPSLYSMNSYVCVEEQEVVCDEYDSLVLSASSISGSSIDSEKNVEDDTFSSKEVTDLITDNTDLASKTYLVCMGDSRTRGKRKANKRKNGENVGRRE